MFLLVSTISIFPITGPLLEISYIMMLSIVLIITDYVAFNCNRNCASNNVIDLTRDKQCIGFYKYLWSEFAKTIYYANFGIVLQDCFNKFKE